MDRGAAAILRHLRTLSAEHGAENFADRELVERFATGRDEAAFEVLVRRHGLMVWRVCQHVTRHEQDAEDAFQAAFLVLARRAAAIRKRASVGSWLYGVAYRVALRARAQASRRPVPEHGNVPMAQADAVTELSHREQQEILHEELSQLTEKYRAPLVLCYLEGKTQDAAARQLAWSINTFRRRLGRARGLLHMRLHRRGLALATVFAAGSSLPPAQGAALPAALVPATVRAACAFATRSGAAGGAATTATALAKSVLRAAAVAQLKMMAVLAVALATLVAGAGVLPRQAWMMWNSNPEPPGDRAVAPAALAPEPAPRARERLDAAGDPLLAEVQARLGTTRLRVGYPVCAGGFAPDSKTFAAASERNVRVWEASTGRCLLTLEGSGGVAFAPDGKKLAAGGLDGTIRLWNLATGEIVREFRGHEQKVYGLALSPDGQTLASGSMDGTLRLWQVGTGKECGRLELPAAERRRSFTWPIAVLPDNRTIATRSLDNRLRLWDAVTGQDLHRLDWLPRATSAVALAPDGTVVAAAGGDPPTIRLWQLASGQEQWQRPSPAGRVDDLAFSEDGRLLASGHEDGMVRLWEVATGVETGQFPTNQAGFDGLSFSSDGRSLASLRDSTTRLWDVTTGAERLPFVGHKDGVLAVAFLSGHERLVSVGMRGTVCQWDPITSGLLSSCGTSQRVMDLAAALSPDGRLLASGNAHGLLRVSDPVTGNELRRWQAHQGPIHGLAFAPDGQTLASASADKTLALWEPITGREIGRWADNPEEVSSVAFAPDGKLLAWGCLDGTIRLQETMTGKVWHRLPRASPLLRALAFSPDGKTLAAGTGPLDVGHGRPAPGRVDLWEVATGQARWHAGIPDGETYALTFAPDGRLLAWGGGGRQIRLWELTTSRELPPLTGHLDEVRCLAFSPDGTLLASGSTDATALVWKPMSLQPRTTVKKEPLSSQEMEAIWSDLASADAEEAYRAIWKLAGAADQAVAFFEARLRPAAVTGTQRENEITTLPPAALLRPLRAVEVLEHIRTPAASELLQMLASGAETSRLTEEARAACARRVGRRDATP
jgi:RNA polymerase sigma factor (sigma-70 family)